MRLYHGTSEWAALQALTDGIKPRGLHGLDNWEHTVTSNPDAVYLTDTYACHFALHAMHNAPRIPDKEKGIRKRIAVLEVETDNLTQSRLHPDEDALEQAGRKYDGIPGSMKQRTLYYRDRARKLPTWELSLKVLGTCAYYGTIKPRHITRVAFFEPKKNREMQWMMMDGSIDITAFHICGFMHRGYMQWLFNDKIRPEDISIMPAELPAEETEWSKMNKDRMKALQEVLDNRSGIEVYAPNEVPKELMESIR